MVVDLSGLAIDTEAATLVLSEDEGALHDGDLRQQRSRQLLSPSTLISIDETVDNNAAEVNYC